MRLELKEDKIIDILMHAATRDDISRLDKKIEDYHSESNMKFDKLDKKIDDVYNELNNKIDSVRVELKNYMQKLDGKLDKMTWMIFGTILMPILIYILQTFNK